MQSWDQSGKSKEDKDAFVFSLDLEEKYDL
jgi:hypothetical protein